MRNTDKERWRNLLLYRMYMTDQEIKDAMPFMLCILGFLILLIVIWGAFADGK